MKESWGFLGWYLLVTFVFSLISFLALSLIVGRKEAPRVIPMLGLVAVADVLVLAVLRWQAGRRWQPLQIAGRVPAWLYLALPLLITAIIILLSVLAFLHLPNWGMMAAFKHTARQPVQTLLLGGLLIPVLEEVLFRGVLLQGLLQHQRPWVAIGQQALLFGIFHLNPAQGLHAFLIGLLLGWLCYRTGSVVLTSCLHALNNLAAFGLLIWFPRIFRSDSSLLDLSGSHWLYAGAVVLSAGVLVALLWRVQQTTTAPQSPARLRPTPLG